MPPIRRLALVPLVAIALRASAQSARAAHLDTLYAGATPIADTYARSDSSESILYVPDSTAPSGQRTVGYLSIRQYVIRGDSPTVFRVVHFAGPTNDVTDSIMIGGTGLRPISETSHQTKKLMHLHFDGRHVTGDVTPQGKDRQTIDQTVPVPPFNSSDVSHIAESLALRAGYSALVATWEYEAGGLRLDTLTVLGRERMDSGVEAWVVRISRGKGTWLEDWLDVRSHKLLREEFGSTDKGWAFRSVRQTGEASRS